MVEADVGLITCVRSPVCHSTRLPVNVRLRSSDERVREGTEIVDKNEESVRLSIPRNAMMITNEDDLFSANKS